MMAREVSKMRIVIQDDHKISVHLMITIQKSGVQKLFDYLVSLFITKYILKLGGICGSCHANACTNV